MRRLPFPSLAFGSTTDLTGCGGGKPFLMPNPNKLIAQTGSKLLICISNIIDLEEPPVGGILY
jgi:hypothetical protein